MPQMIDNYANAQAVIALVEVMEIKGNNPHIKALQRTCWEEFAKIVEGSTANFLYGVIAEARRKVREESNAR